MQLVEGLRQVEAGLEHVLQADLDRTAGVLVGAEEIAGAEGHQVAKTGRGCPDPAAAGGGGLQHRQRPEEILIWRSQPDALLQTLLQLRVTGDAGGVVPLQRQSLVPQLHGKYLALAAAPQSPLDL